MMQGALYYQNAVTKITVHTLYVTVIHKFAPGFSNKIEYNCRRIRYTIFCTVVSTRGRGPQELVRKIFPSFYLPSNPGKKKAGTKKFLRYISLLLLKKQLLFF